MVFFTLFFTTQGFSNNDIDDAIKKIKEVEAQIQLLKKTPQIRKKVPTKKIRIQNKKLIKRYPSKSIKKKEDPINVLKINYKKEPLIQEKSNFEENIEIFKKLNFGNMILPTGSSLLEMNSAPLKITPSKEEIKKEIEERPLKKNIIKVKKVAIAKRSTPKKIEDETIKIKHDSIKNSQEPKTIKTIQKIEKKEPEVKIIDIDTKKEIVNTKIEVPVEETKIKTPIEENKIEKILSKENKVEEKKNIDLEDIDNELYINMPVSIIETKESPQVKFSGDICSFIGTSRQDDSRDNKDGDPHIAFGWADLTLEIAGATFGDVHYKYHANLEIIPEGMGVNENYFEISSIYGILQVGNLKGPDATFIENGTSMLGGTGGCDGSFYSMFNMPVGLPNMHYQAGYSKRATKLVYYTSRLFGFQMGVGFSPNPQHAGWNSMGSKGYNNTNDNGIFSSDEIKKRMNVSFGINFEQKIENFILKAALVAVKEKSTLKVPISQETPNKYSYTKYIPFEIHREVPLKQDTSCHASTSLKYNNFQIAAGLIKNGSINLPDEQLHADLIEKYGLHLGDSGKVWNIGGKYTLGCVDIGVAYNKAKRKVTGFNYSEGKVTSLTVDCQIVSGIKVFAEIDYVKAETDPRVAAIYENKGPSRNSGTVIMVGSKISF